MAWFSHETMERPNTFSRGDTMDFFQELGEGAKEMLKNQSMEAEDKDKEKEKGMFDKDRDKVERKKKKKTSSNRDSKRLSTSDTSHGNSGKDEGEDSLLAYIKDQERKEKHNEGTNEGGGSSSSDKKRRTPRIQFTEPEEDARPRASSDDKLKPINRNSRAWSSFGGLGGINPIRSFRSPKAESPDKEEKKERKEREKEEKEREKEKEKEREKEEKKAKKEHQQQSQQQQPQQSPQQQPQHSPRKVNHERNPSWGSQSFTSSSGSFPLPSRSNDDLKDSPSSNEAGEKRRSAKIIVGDSFESPKENTGSRSDRRERDLPPLHRACLQKDSVMARQLIEDAIKHKKLKHLLFDRDSKGRTPLHIASESKGGIGVLALVLSLSAEDMKSKYMQKLLNSADLLGRTALHCAASQGLLSHCHLLLRYEADGSLQVDPDKATVLHHLAVCKPFSDTSENDDKIKSLTRLILESGVDINSKTYPSGETCLHLAALSGNKLLFDSFVEFGGDINALTAANENCLHYAARGGHADMVEFLLALGIDPNVEGKNGKPDQIAKSEEVLQVLRRHNTAQHNNNNNHNHNHAPTTKGSGEDRPLPPSPTDSQELMTRKALYKP